MKQDFKEEPLSEEDFKKLRAAQNIIVQMEQSATIVVPDSTMLKILTWAVLELTNQLFLRQPSKRDLEKARTIIRSR